MTGLRIGIVGATGAVGRELLDLLQTRAFPVGTLRLLASSRSAGTTLEFGGETVAVEEAREEVFSELDVALMSAGSERSRAWGRYAASRGCVVVDNSSAFRMEDDVPLVIPEINAAALRGHRNLIANPNCTTIVNAMAIAPLHRAFGLERMVVASYQAASGAGAAGLDELWQGARAILDGAAPAAEVFPAPLAFNVVPLIGTAAADGGTDEEAKMGRESAKILDLPNLEVACTCVRVPVPRAHGVATTAWFRDLADPGDAAQVLDAAPGVRRVDLPTPDLASGGDDVLVGRLRRAAVFDRGLSFFAVGDQVRKGAALNAIQIAEHVISGSC
ncbi:MAG: aspartate-semialdehyde dehydrogenase [Planctomycetes bacterium]|nr:aspartate-semialdehyde dehydrogenase [Planctomycetota bacterium]